MLGPSQDVAGWRQPICSGRRWMGDSRVSGCDQPYPFDEKKGKGTEGATTSPKGKENAKPKITFIFWVGWRDGEWWDGFAAWAAYRSVFEPPAEGDASAIIIEHPQFALAKIRGVVVTKIGDVVAKDGGRGEVTVEFLEYRKAKKVGTGAPDGASKGAGQDGRPKTDAELKAEAKWAEAESLWQEIAS